MGMRQRLVLSLIVVVPLLVGWITLRKPVAPNALVGVWTAAGVDGQSRSTWQFGRKGKGRHQLKNGRSTRTRTFAYEVDGTVVNITFDADGQRHSSPFAAVDETLRLATDLFDGGDRAYAKVTNHEAPSVYGAYATWGEDGSFEMYQMLAPNWGGRGRGWVHTGNASDWTTKPFEYSASRRSLFLTSNNQLQVAFRVAATSALYRMSQDEEVPCAYVQVRARASRWLQKTPQPYAGRPSPRVIDSHEKKCRRLTRTRRSGR